ncbi:MAG: photosystem II repair protein Psb32 [Synechococcus sp.]
MLRTRSLLAGLLASCLSLLLVVPASFAVAPVDFPATAPEENVIDSAEVLSRASRSDISTGLAQLKTERVDARLVTVRRLDYGLSLNQFGDQLLARWSSDPTDLPFLLLLIESQNKQAAVVADPLLLDRLPDELLKSTGRTTMSQPLRDGDRYRQASLDGISRLDVVLKGGADPGPPVESERTTLPTNIPTVEETRESNAFTWVVVLLVVGTIVPMATWWIFSR